MERSGRLGLRQPVQLGWARVRQRLDYRHQILKEWNDRHPPICHRQVNPAESAVIISPHALKRCSFSMCLEALWFLQFIIKCKLRDLSVVLSLCTAPPCVCLLAAQWLEQVSGRRAAVGVIAVRTAVHECTSQLPSAALRWCQSTLWHSATVCQPNLCKPCQDRNDNRDLGALWSVLLPLCVLLLPVSMCVGAHLTSCIWSCICIWRSCSAAAKGVVNVVSTSNTP